MAGIQRWTIFSFITICFLFLQLPGFELYADPVKIDSKIEEIVLGPYLFFLEDPNGEFSVSDFETTYRDRFLPVGLDVPSFGVSKSVFWFRLELENITKREEVRILELDSPLVDSATLYLMTDPVIVKRGGEEVAIRNREIQHRNTFFKLDLQPGKKLTVFLRLHDEGGIPYPLKLWKPDSLMKKEGTVEFGMGLYYGILLIMSFYNLFLFFSIKDMAYLYYSLYLGFLTLMQMALEGRTFEYFWPDATPWWLSRSGLIFFTLAGIFATLFTRKILNTARFLPLLDRLIQFVLLVSGLNLFVSLYNYSFIVVSLILSVISLPLLFIVGLLIWRKGYVPAKYFLTGWTLFLIGGMLNSLYWLGFLEENFLTRYGHFFGTVLEVSLFSLALGNRITLLQKDKIRVQQEAMEEQVQMTRTFKKFVPGQFLERVASEGIKSLRPGNIERDFVSILFSDIRSFTNFSENNDPGVVFDFLNRYMSHLEPAIERNNGFVDKYIGDAIMALFASGKVEARVASSVDAALGLLSAVESLNRTDRFDFEAKTGIGIHAGPVILGIVGSSNRMDSTAIGDAVNVASRLEGLTKVYGVSLIISEEVLKQLPASHQYLIRLLDIVQVKGKTKSIVIYEVFNHDPEEKKALKLKTMALLEKALSFYQKGDYRETLRCMDEYRKIFPEDSIATILPTRCIEKLEAELFPDKQSQASET